MKFEPALRIQDFAFELVPTSRRLDELAAQGFEFGIQGIRARKMLDKGALMFCIFVAKELSCVHWAATTREAMDSLIKVHCKVDLQNNEVYLGWSETTPKYRYLGLSQYLISEKMKLFKTMGKTTGKWIVAKSNLASQGLTTKIGGKVYAEARYLRILWWKSWKEKPAVQQASIERTGVE